MREKNCIVEMKDEFGNHITSQSGIKALLQSYFEDSFLFDHPSPDEIEVILQGISSKVTSCMNFSLST